MEISIQGGVIKSAQKVLIYGQHGIGKTTLASKWPGAVFIDLERGTLGYDVNRLPVPTSWTELLQEVNWAAQNMCGRTLVIDSADWAERLCEQYVCQQKGVQGIEDFGYGKGYKILADEFSRLLRGLSLCVTYGVNVVLVAHDNVSTITLPGSAAGYSVFGLKLSKHVAPLVKEWADAVLYCRYRTLVIQDEGKSTGHAIGGEERVMQCTHTATIDAKNRWGLDGEMPMDYEVIRPFIEG